MRLRLLVALARVLLLRMGTRIDLAPPRWRIRVESVRDHPDLLDQHGIYAWYADARARARLRRAGVPVHDDGPVYIGKTTGSFRKRVLGKHINGNSTLRKTLKSILIKTGSAAAGADAEVGRFMRAHFRVAMLPLSICLIAKAEGRLIQECEPCLNLTNNRNAASRERIRDLRRRFARRRGGIAWSWWSRWG